MQAEGGQHNFVKTYFSSPTWCGVCTQFIWGVTSKQGYRCTECHGTAHGKCCVHAKPCQGKKGRGSHGHGEGGGKAHKEGKGGKEHKEGKGGKGGKAAKGAAHKFKKMHRKEFKETDVGAFDDFFGKVQEPLDSVCEMGEKVANSVDQVHELFHADEVVHAGVVAGDLKGLFTFYIKEIRKVDGGDFKFDIDDEFKPELKIKGKHAGRVEDFVSALEEMVANVTEFVEKCPELIAQIAEFGLECADFPAKLQGEAMGMSPLKIPGAIKKTAENVKYLGGVPGEFKEIFENIKNLLKLLKDVATETV
jgi:hypothetical protein